MNKSAITVFLWRVLALLFLGLFNEMNAGRLSDSLARSHSVVLYGSFSTDSVSTLISPLSIRRRIFKAVFLKSCSMLSPDSAEVS